MWVSRTYLTLPSLKDECRRNYELMARPLREDFDDKQIEDMHKVLLEMPTIHTEVYIRGPYGQESEIDRLVKQPPSNTDWMDIYAGHVSCHHCIPLNIKIIVDIKGICPSR